MPKYITTNTDLAANDAYFRQCCEAASTPPTRRQASKFRRHQGTAFRTGKPRVDHPTPTPMPR